MNSLVILKKHFTKNKLYNLIKGYLDNYLSDKKTIVFDIHNTIEYDNTKIDNTAYNAASNGECKLSQLRMSSVEYIQANEW